MIRRWLFLGVAGCLLALCLFANLASGASMISWRDVLGALLHFDADNFDHVVVLQQRLPRALIAIYVGAVTSCGGAVLQGLTRNPLASPATLGISAGATFFVVAGVALFGLGAGAQGMAALAGAIFGFSCCLVVARLAGLSHDPRGLALILSGALMSMLFIGLANAVLLSDPMLRSDFLGWVTGNFNHAYADRLRAFWWIGAVSCGVLLVLARPLTLITLGAEKAASAGVHIAWVSGLALAAVMLGAGSAVAICGPVGFVGLVVPHIVRPFVGAGFAFGLPACALTGASICLLADVIARLALAPYVLHTGVIMDILGGLVFIVIVRRFYLTPGRQA